MPGGRLTYQDRQYISKGLADGLSHAEIARRLERPTSTVSREILRNSGFDGYRPDRAQQATGMRARRRAAATPKRTPAVVAEFGRDPAAVLGFAEQLAAVLVGMGQPRMMAKVLVALFLTDSGSLTAAELRHKLDVSPASISKAVGCLEQQGLIRREQDSRRERYIVAEDVWVRSWLANARTNLTLADAARRGVRIFGAATPAGVRLAGMGDFLEHVGRELIVAAERYRAAH